MAAGVAVNDRRRKTGKAPISIPTDDAWFYYAKLRFPDEKVWGITDRDAWLINTYRHPSEPWSSEDSFSWPGLPIRASAPAELVDEVDRAYYRQWMQQQVDAWFEANGFDLSQPTIPKHLFEAAVQAEFGQSAKVEQLSPKPIRPLKKHQRYPGDNALVEKAVKGIPKKYSNAQKAAEALASQAEGSATESSKVDRLRRKINRALSTP